jgi:hypothetical protein
MSDTPSRNLEPWVVIDSDSKREWVLPKALQYYVVEDEIPGRWFICDRFTDSPVPSTNASTRAEAIRLFYKWCSREMPLGRTIGDAPPGVAHHGETGLSPEP